MAACMVEAHDVRLAARPMSTWSLPSLFSPASVAVIGGSPRERSIGRALLRNLQSGGFVGSIGLVNPRHREIEGVAAVARVADLSFVPELVLIATPAAMVPKYAKAAAEHGASAAVVLSTGLEQGEGSFAAELQEIARAHGMQSHGRGERPALSESTAATF